MDTTRNPRLAENEDHVYDNKYALAEFLTNTAVAAQINALQRLGLEPEKLQQVLDWVHTDHKSVTLRFRASDTCTFLREQVVELVSDRGHATTTTTTTTNAPATNNPSPTIGGGGGYFGMGIVSGGGINKQETTTSRVTTRVKEYHFKVGVAYTISIFCGNDPTDCVELLSRDTSAIIVTAGGASRPGIGFSTATPPTPIAESTTHPAVDTNLTWFFQMIAPEEQICQFAVDRNAADNTCKTPRRNADVDAAVEFSKQLFDWTRITQGFFLQRVETEIMGQHKPVKPATASDGDDNKSFLGPGTHCSLMGLVKEQTLNGKHVSVIEYDSKQDRYRVEALGPAGIPPTLLIKRGNLKVDAVGSGLLSSITALGLFCPILPLMEEQNVLAMADVGEFLGEQNRSIDEAIELMAKVYPPRQLVKLVSIAEATIVLMCQHVQHLTLLYQDSVDYVEDMLKQQLIQAIGKEIVTKDFDQFMRFHNQKLFGAKHAPKPFSYAIRRPAHYPDGILTIEATRNKNEPVSTMVRTILGAEAPSVYIPINAATSVEITGDRHLHGWLQHRFQSKPQQQYQLIARARQFSSFLLIVGTMAGPDAFEPKEAIILQNKDEVLIPLLTNVLPTAKEFKDAVSSLSSEQKAFAESFRAMQLESSVFGVCIIQLKPQLEKLLDLPEGSLTKEIQLTQDLMSLFVDYQIPSDLLSFDGPGDGDILNKVTAVKGYVKSVMDVIEASKEKQLIEEERKADMRAERAYGGPAPSTDSGDYLLTEMSEGLSPSRNRRAGGGGGDELANQISVPRMRMMDDGAGPPGAPSPQPTQQVTYARADGKQVRRLKKPSTPTSGMRLEQVQPGKPLDQKEFIRPPDLSGPVSAFSGEGEDFTLIPKLLDQKLEKYDTSNALRSTIIKAGPNWTRMRQANLLTPIKSSILHPTDVDTEKKRAFDLLDAISRSGTLPIACAELHVIVAVSHCFDNDLMGTVIQDNINPIEKVERSSLMIASTIYGEPAPALVKDAPELERLTASFPLLFDAEASDRSD